MAKKYKTLVMQEVEKMFLDGLEKEAYSFIQDTLQTIKNGGHRQGYYEHKTLNLYDSYGFGIFRDGSLLRRGWLSSKASSPREFKDGHVVWGREILQTLFNGSDRTTTSGYVVLIAAAMPYALNLEHGIGIQNKYRVISFMDDEAKNFGKKTFGFSLVDKVNVRDWGSPSVD